jgi:hypothetical protein
LYRGSRGAEVSIESHWSDEDGILAEPDFSLYSTLVYVNNPDREMEEKLDMVERLELLRSEEA